LYNFAEYILNLNKKLQILNTFIMKKQIFLLSFSGTIIFFLLSPQLVQAQVEWADYPGKLPKEHEQKVKFGYLTVPENHDQPDGRKIQVAFSLLKSEKNNTQDALIILPGGPGGSATKFTDIIINLKPIQKILEQKDIILLDPRGCGNSSPSLCDNLNELEIHYPYFFGRTDEEIESLITNAVKACKDTLDAADIEPKAYNSVAVAHDVEMLRKALGYDQWILRGHSYGSYYSQAVIHCFPQSVKAAVLSGLVPKGSKTDLKEFYNMARSFDLTLETCSNDSVCKQEYPGLRERFVAVLEKLDKNPLTLHDVADKSAIIDANAFMSIAFAMSYLKNGLEIFPLLIESAEKNYDWVFKSLANALLATFLIENDMLQIISLNDKTYLSKPTNIFKDDFTKKLYRYDRTALFYKINQIYIDILGLKPHAFDTTQQLYDTPILLYDGLYDPITPPANTNEVAAYFPNHFKFTVADKAHDSNAGATEGILQEYTLNPGQQPDLSGLEGQQGLQFATNINFNRGVSSLAAKVITNKYLTTAIVAGVLIVLLLIGFFYFPVRFLVRKFRKKPVTLPLTLNLSTWLVTFLGFGFVVLLAMAVMDTMATNQYLAVFGLTDQWSFIFIIPWILVAVLVASLYFSKSVWQTNTGNKIFWSVSWLGGMGMVVFLWVNGFIW